MNFPVNPRSTSYADWCRYYFLDTIIGVVFGLAIYYGIVKPFLRIP